jgi:hypothetical protein
LQQNPYIVPRAGLAEDSSSDTPALRQPYLLALALFVAGISALLASSLLQGFAGVPFGQVLRAVPGLLGPWLTSLLISSAVAVLFMQAQRERHAIREFRPFALIVVVFLLLSGAAVEWLAGLLRDSGREFALWLADVANLMGLLSPLAFLTSAAVQAGICLIPLWLVLLLTRSHCVRQPSQAMLPIARLHVAFGVALGFAAITGKLLSGLARLFLASKVGAWGLAVEIAAWAVPFALVLVGVLRQLPPQVPRYAAGRVVLAALTISLGWSFSVVLVELVGYVLLQEPLWRLQAASGLPVLPLLAILVALLLLASWTFTGARWLPERKRRAQSSPR